MGTIAGIIASFAASHLGGLGLGGLMASKGWLGFAGGASKLIVRRRMERRATKAAADLESWLENETDERE